MSWSGHTISRQKESPVALHIFMQKNKMLCLFILYHIIALHFQNSNDSESNSSNNESLLLLFWWPLESEGPVCYYHVMYAFQSEYALCSSLNVKERLPRNRRDIWSLSEYRTDKYSQSKLVIRPVWQNGWVFVYEQSDCGFEYRCCNIQYCV